MAVHLSYHLIRSKKRRKTISLHIKEDGKVVIHVPYHTPKWEIEKFIKEKQSWVVQKISEKEKQIKEGEKTFRPGERFYYLGEWYPLEIHESNHKGPPLRLSFGNFNLNKDHIGGAKDLFIQWYKREAKEKIVGRGGYCSRQL